MNLPVLYESEKTIFISPYMRPDCNVLRNDLQGSGLILQSSVVAHLF